ncbi:MAG: precorrin-4 C(11)-methyltransferase [Oscillospiraceae bacterium]|jgi:precorrin-4/cobalt-precorrin-4 C11-methyltransferase|nr:precorrin-4 C(11)-methyltransferase [Oscillospiraceae bacterium]
MVHFVGAGPGAEDLITLRGARLIETADAIIYAGSLVNPALLSRARTDCEIFNSAEMTLEQVIAVITAPERASREIVRLHTGDSSIYGAVREQMELLDAAGIDYDVCPGVSSFCGAASSLRAEYTLPGVSQTVILTRMEGRTPVPEREEISSLAAHGATMVIFLSTGMLDELSRRLLLGGYADDTPAAIVYKATWPDERILRTTVGEMAAAARDAGISKTALVTVGNFLGGVHDRSKLYDPAFTTEFRQGTATEQITE